MHTETQEGQPQADAGLAGARRAGLAVLGIGALELVYGIATAPAGTIRLQFLGVLTGLLMLFGGLRVLAVLRWLALLALGSGIWNLLTPFVLLPADLALTQMRLYPAAYAASWIPLLVWVAIPLVVALRLGHPALQAARLRAGRTLHSARIPLVLGLLLAAGVAALQFGALGGAAAHKAESMAAARFGPGYRYTANALNTVYGRPRRYFATVQAWNADAVMTVPVQWAEQE